jgi:hypothetical protein
MPGSVRHDGPVRRLWRGVAAVGAAAVLAGCSVLSGTTSTTKTRASAFPESSSPAVDPATQAAFAHPKVVKALLAAAAHDFETIYTYDYRNISKYRDAGLSVTTSPYADEYGAIFDGKARDKLVASQYVQVGTATSAGLASITGTTHAKVIIRGNLQVISASNPEGASKSVTFVLKLIRPHRSWLVSNVTEGASAQGSIPANAALRSAMTAARVTVELLYGLRRHGFQAQFDRLVAKTAGDLHDSLTTHEAALRKTLDDGKYDLSSKIAGFAVVEASTEPKFIVAVDEYRNARQHTRLGPYRHVFSMTADYRNGHWVITSATPLT